MPLYTYDGLLLRADSLLAASANCCCNQNKCCLLGECFDNISDEFCTAMGGYIDTGACGPFDGTTPTTGACVCNPSTTLEDRVDCCVDGQVFYSGDGTYPDDELVLSECDCLAVGGTVYTGDPCTNEGCDFGDTTASPDGIVCLPGGTCLAVCSGCALETLGDVCLYTYIGGVFTPGGTCPDDCTGAVDPGTNDLTCEAGQKCQCHQVFFNICTGSTFCPVPFPGSCVTVKRRDKSEYWNEPTGQGNCKKFLYSHSLDSGVDFCGGNPSQCWKMCIRKCQCVPTGTTCPTGTSKGWSSVSGACASSSTSSTETIAACYSPPSLCPR